LRGFARFASCFVAGFGRKTVTHFSGTCLALVVLVLGACSRESEEPPVEIRPVRTTAVQEHKPSREVRFAGTVESQVQIDLSFRIGGRVMERLVNVGDSVEAGQLVARLDPSDEENNLRAAEASLNAADGQLSEARLNYDRQRHLFDRQIVARAALDRVEQALNTARAASDAAQANVGIAQRRLDDTELRADAPGVVTIVNVEPGEVTAAGRMVVQLARDGGKDAVFNVPASALAESPPDPQVVVALSLPPAATAEGRVREVSPRADPVTGTFQVRVGLINPPAEMRLGSAVTGTATFGGVAGLEIPASALTRSSGEPAVWVVDPATNKVALRIVEIADFSPTTVIVSNGLAVGEVVVTAGVQALRPGQEVRLLGGVS
jgi:RND family efflux transporter MFP subunit